MAARGTLRIQALHRPSRQILHHASQAAEKSGGNGKWDVARRPLARAHAERETSVNTRDCAPASLVCQEKYIQLVVVRLRRKTWRGRTVAKSGLPPISDKGKSDYSVAPGPLPPPPLAGAELLSAGGWSGIDWIFDCSSSIFFCQKFPAALRQRPLARLLVLTRRLGPKSGRACRRRSAGRESGFAAKYRDRLGGFANGPSRRPGLPEGLLSIQPAWRNFLLRLFRWRQLAVLAPDLRRRSGLGCSFFSSRVRRAAAASESCVCGAG
jgi:hypothetical protein